MTFASGALVSHRWGGSGWGPVEGSAIVRSRPGRVSGRRRQREESVSKGKWKSGYPGEKKIEKRLGRARSPSRQDSGGPEEACEDEEAKGLVGNPVGSALTGWLLLDQ